MTKFIIPLVLMLAITFNSNAQNSDTTTVQSSWMDMMFEENNNFYEIQNSFNSYWKNRIRQKGDGWKVYKRWESYWQTRVNADGSFPVGNATLKAYEQMQVGGRQLYSTNGSWVSSGPTPLPSNTSGQPNGLGRVNVVVEDPSNAQTIWVGTPSGGLWKSTNGGSSWIPKTDDMPTLGITSLLIDTANTSIMYMGTGDGDANDAPGLGVYKSVNGGTTWNASNAGMGNKTVSKLAFGMTNSIILAATNSGIYKSTNSGATWIKKSVTANFRDIVYKPGSYTIAYATSYSYSNGAKLYRTMNGGNTWTQITYGLTNTGYRMSIGVSPASSNMVYLVAGDADGLVAIYKSINGANSFTSVYSTLNILGREFSGSGTSSQAWYDLAIAVSPTNANIIHVGGINVWKSINGGTSWSINGFWLNGYGVPVLHADHHYLGYGPSGVLYNGNDGGISKTTNGGTTWVDKSSGLGIAQIYKIGQSGQTAHITMAGFQDNGTGYQSALNTWVTVIGGDGMECIIDPTSNSYKYGALYYGDIRRSTYGSSFSTIAENGVNGINEDGAWVTPYILAEGLTTTMFAGYENVWRSTNVKAVNTSSINFTKISSFTATNNVSVIENSPINNALLYIVKGNTTAYRSVNALSANPVWTALGTLGSSQITDIEAHPTNVNIVYATAGNNIYKSLNKGATWTNITGNITSGAKNCIVFDISSADGLYVGTDIGVFYKDATMTNWVNFSLGLPAAGEVTELEIYYDANRNNSRIKAATYGRGLWSSDLYSITTSLTVDFNADYTSGCTGANIEFNDLTAPAATSWQWIITPSTYAYINGTSDTSQNPKIQFNTSGSYSIKLVAGNSSGTDSITKTNYISITNPYNTPLTEDFASFMVGAPGTLANGWTTENSGAFDWRVNNNATQSPDTGPSADHTTGGTNGIYMYTEATAPAALGEIASLISPCLNIAATGQTVLKFYYHMYGAGVSALNIDIYANDVWTNIYTITGSQQFSNNAAWLQANVSLASYIGSTVKLRFRVIRGNLYTCDIAIDDIFIGQSGGAIADFNANELSPVIGSIVQFNDLSLNTPTAWDWSFTPSTVSFVGGTSANSQNPKVKFNAAGSYSAKLVTSNTIAGDSLIKNSYIVVQTANSIPSFESFQTFTVGTPGVFTNGWVATSIGNFPWYVNNGPTTSTDTGPNADHTTGNISGKYLFTEASGITTADIAVLESPYYDFSSISNPRISFWYHMYGQDIVGLDMDVFYNGAWINNVNQIVGQQHVSNTVAYTKATVNLDAYANSVLKIRFRITHMAGNANSTFRSDIAIDDFSAYEFIPIINDEPCGAINLIVSDTCSYSTYTNVTASSSIGVPPPGCGGSITQDVWFKILIPNTGTVIIDAEPISGDMVDGAMAAYTGSCGSLTLLSCNDDYQGSVNMPHIELTNQNPGDTIYVRFWKYGGGVGNFQMCVSRPPYFILSPTNITTTYSAGSSIINVSASNTITWSVSDNAGWLTLNPITATGSTTITASYSANASGSRSAIITGIAAGFANQTVTITQNGYIVAGFTSSNYMLCENSTETFVNTSQNAISSIWYVDGVQQATTTNFNYTFSNAGQYVVKLKIIGAFYNDSISRNYFVGDIPTAYAGNDTTICEGENIALNSSVVTGLVGCDTNCDIPTYCTSNSNNDENEYIIKVKIGNIEMSSAKSGIGVQDFTSSLFMPVNIDSTYLITVTGFTTASWPEQVEVFIDWNRNGLFDEASISLGTATFVGSHNFIGFVTSPSNAVLGKTMMRVIMKYDGNITGGCQAAYNFGETEDYMLKIVKNDTLDYSWTGPASYTSTEISPVINNIATSQSGDYVLSMSNAYSCISTDSAAITVEPYPNVNINNIPDVCISGANITLTQGSPAGGTYSGTGVSNGIFYPSVAGIGTHNIIYYATSNSGCSNADTTTITVNALPVLSFNSLPSQLCVNEPNITLIATPAGGTFTGNGIEMFNQFNASLATIGSNALTYHYTDANQCSDSVSQSVIVNSLPIVSAGNDTIINYGTVATLNGQVSNVNTHTTLWLPVSKVINSTINPAITQSLTLSQEFTFKATDIITTCSDSDFVMVNITGGSLSISTTTAQGSICYGDSVQLQAIASGGVGAYSYIWTSSIGSFNDNTYNPMVSPVQNTWYRVAVSDNSTTIYDSVFVQVFANPTLNFDVISETCEGADSINMTNITPAGGTFSGVGVVGNTFNASITGVGTHYITYTYTNSNGCTGTKTKDITVNANPIITFNILPAQLCSNGANIILTASPAGGSFVGDGVELSNQFNPTLAGLGFSSVTYHYTDVNQCSDSAIQNTIVNSLPIVYAGNDTTINYGTAANLVGNISNVSGSYNILWTPTSKVISSTNNPVVTTDLLVSQEFTLNIYDISTNCSDSDKVMVFVSGGILSLSVTGSQASICNGDSLQLLAIASGGVGAYTYSWSSSVGSFTANTYNPTAYPSQNAWYKVTVSDNISTIYDSVFVQVFTNPTPDFDIISETCEGVDGINITNITPAGGVFSGVGVVGNTFNASNAGVGTHDITYTYTNNNLCTGVKIKDITVNALPILSFNSLPAEICLNDDNVTLSASPAGGSFVGDGVVASIQFNPSLALVGSATVTYHYTDANQCSDSISQGTYVNSLPIVNAGNDTTINYGTAFTLLGSISNVSTAYTTFWGPAGKVLNSTSNPATTISLLLSQEFVLNVVDLNTQCSESDFVMVNITGGFLSVLTTTADDSICYGDYVQIQAIASGGVGAYSYSWTSNVGSFTDNTYNPTVAPIQNTWYRVAISDNTTTLYDSVFVEVIPNPIPNFDIISDVCESEPTISMTNMTPSGGIFSGLGVVGNTFSASIAGVGTHSITYYYTNSNGCTGTKTKDITVNASPIIIMNSIGDVCNSSANISLNIATPYGGNYMGNYVSNNIFNPSAAGVGSHKIYYLFTDQNACYAVDSTFINVTSSPIVDAGLDQNILPNATASLAAIAIGGSGNYSYNWTPTTMVVNANLSTTNTVSLSNSQLYKVVVIDNQSMCKDSDNVVVIVTGTPLVVDINIPQNPICEGDSMEITAVPTGGSGTYTYSWTSSPAGFTSSIQNPKVAPSSTTAFMVTLNDGANTANDGKFVIVDGAPLKSLPTDTGVCDNSSIELDAGGGYDIYQWSDGATTRKNIIDGSTIPSGNTMYYVTITNANGCSLNDSVNIALNLSPANMLGNDTAICQQESMTLDGGDNMISYLWNTGDNSQTITVDGSIGMGNYTYWVRSESIEGCIGTDSVSLDIVYCNSIEDIKNDNYSVKLYPNPNNGNFNIDVQSTIIDDVLITVFDSRGREVSRDKMPIVIGENSKNISINNLSKGMYIIYLRGEKVYSVRKLIIK